ncbi:AraC family transcriptional regulator [Paenibacillus sp. FA6]|uniref:AraC family transcriptional regulator n=1 Tax=Paenibacillus sp. FA6 TaxID=3413029 RepID=UPI003F65BC50
MEKQGDSSSYNDKFIQRINVLKEASIFRNEIGQGPFIKHVNSPTLLSVGNGRAELLINDKSIDLQQGNIVFIRPDTTFEFHNHSAKPLQIYLVAYEIYEMRQRTEQDIIYTLSRDSLFTGITEGQLIKKTVNLIQELADCWEGKKETGSAHDLLAQLLHLAFKNGILSGRGIFDGSSQKLLSYIHEHYAESLDRSTIAHLTGFNPRYFSEWFRIQTGWTFTKYVTRIRVNEAKQLLLSSGGTLDEIANKVGYSDGLYLSRKFKQICGMTPSEFRSRPKPKRIIALQFVGNLLVLGIKPIAVETNLLHHSMLLSQELDDVYSLDIDDKASLEGLTMLEADMVIASTYPDPKLMKVLEKVAPVVTIQCDKMDRLEEIRLFGRLFGEEERVEDWIEGYRRKAAIAKRKLMPLIRSDETIAVYEMRGNDYLYIWNRTTRGVYNLYDMLDMRPPERVKKDMLEQDEHLYLHESLLVEYAADHMFVVASDGLMEQTKNWLENSPIWNGLPAFNNKKIYFLKLEAFWHSEGLSLERQLEVQTNMLTRNDSI